MERRVGGHRFDRQRCCLIPHNNYNKNHQGLLVPSFIHSRACKNAKLLKPLLEGGGEKGRGV